MSQPLRIVLCVAAFEPAREYGGPVVKVKALALSLRSLGHDVQVWAADFGPARTRVPAGRRDADGVDVTYVRRVAAYRWTPIVPAGFSYARRADADLVHCFGLRDGMTIPTALGFRSRGKPYVVEPMGMHAPRVRKVALKKAVDAAFGQRYLDGAAAVIATSRLEADELREAVAEPRLHVRLNPLTLQPQPVDDGARAAARRRFGISASAYVGGFIGRLSIKKGLDLLVAAAHDVPDLHLVVAGPPEDEAAVAALEAAARGPLRGRVHVLGPVWDEGRDDLLRTFDVFVLPSRTENFGNAAAEAIARGVPVIVSDQCGIADLVVDVRGGLVVGVDVAALRAALRELRDPDARAHYTSSSDRLARLLDPVTIARQQAEIYRQVLA